MGLDYQTILPEIGGKIGEVLLQPHVSYLGPLMPLIEQKLIHGLAHITGGGLTDNVPRILPDGLDAVIKLGSWEVPPVFRVMYEKGDVEAEEMLRVFNMGIGMVLLIDPSNVEVVSKRLEAARQKYYFIGNVRKGSGTVEYDRPPAGFASWIE